MMEETCWLHIKSTTVKRMKGHLKIFYENAHSTSLQKWGGKL
jgi:hypothetical protein